MNTPHVKIDFRGLDQYQAALKRDLRESGNGPIRQAMHQWAVRYRSFLQERFDRFSKGGGDWAPLAVMTILRRRAGRGKSGTRGKAVKALARRQRGMDAQQVRLYQQIDRLATQRRKATTTGKREAVEAKILKAQARMDVIDSKHRSLGSKIKALYSMAGVSILRNLGLLFAALSPEFIRKPGQLQEDIPFGVRVGYGGPGKYPGSKASIADIASFHQEGRGRLPVRKIIVPPDDQTMQKMADDMRRAIDRIIRDSDIK
jgi:hypothetical protein